MLDVDMEEAETFQLVTRFMFWKLPMEDQKEIAWIVKRYYRARFGNKGACQPCPLSPPNVTMLYCPNLCKV